MRYSTYYPTYHSLQTPTPVPEMITVTISIIGNGTVTVNGQQISSITVPKETRIMLVATPDLGYKFSGWTMPSASSGIMNNPYDPYIRYNGTIIAVFEQIPTQPPIQCTAEQFKIPLVGCQNKYKTILIGGIGAYILYKLKK